jgi:hypothetical protein
MLVGIGNTAAENPARSGQRAKESTPKGQMKQQKVGVKEDKKRNLRQMINDPRELRRLQWGDMTRGGSFVNGKGRGQVYYAAIGQGRHSEQVRGGGKGNSKGKGRGGYDNKSGGGSSDGDLHHNVGDNFFPTRGRRSRYRLQPLDEGSLATVIHSAVIAQPHFHGTGIGRIDRPRGRFRPAQQSDGNRFPPGFRRPNAQAPTSPSLPTPTIIPSTIAPAMTPVLSQAPLPPGTTGAPTLAGSVAPVTTAGPIASNATNDIVIRSSFALTYFTDQATDVDRDLTPEEYAELATHMDSFFAAAFQMDPAFSNDFLSYKTAITAMNYVMGRAPQVMLDFDANFSFAGGSAITPNQVLAKMEPLDYSAFIENNLQGDPINQLDAVQMVNFAASVAPA